MVSISILRVAGEYFPFVFENLIEHCKQTLDTLIRRSVLRALFRVCTVCILSHKKDATLIWVKLKSYDIKFIYIGLLKS